MCKNANLFVFRWNLSQPLYEINGKLNPHFGIFFDGEDEK